MDQGVGSVFQGDFFSLRNETSGLEWLCVMASSYRHGLLQRRVVKDQVYWVDDVSSPSSYPFTTVVRLDMQRQERMELTPTLTANLASSFGLRVCIRLLETAESVDTRKDMELDRRTGSLTDSSYPETRHRWCILMHDGSRNKKNETKQSNQEDCLWLVYRIAGGNFDLTV